MKSFVRVVRTPGNMLVERTISCFRRVFTTPPCEDSMNATRMTPLTLLPVSLFLRVVLELVIVYASRTLVTVNHGLGLHSLGRGSLSRR